MKSVITVYSAFYLFGGIEYLFIQLAKFLKKKKIKLIVICFEDKINLGKYEKNIKVIKLSNNQNFIKKAINLKETIDNINYKGMVLLYDLKSSAYAQLANIKNYNVALTDPPSLAKKNLSRLYSKMKWHRKYKYKIKDKIFKKIAKQGIENANKTFVMSKWNSKEFKKKYKVQPKVIYPGIFGEFNKKGVTCKILHPKKNLNLISISRLTKSKNLIWLLYGVKHLLNKNEKNKFFKNINLKILGSGPELTNLKNISKKLNIFKNIKFYGKVSENKKNKLISASHINLIAAYSAYNLPALESIRMGVPVVINEACRMKEVLKNNKMTKNTKNNQSSFIKSLDNYVEILKKKKIKNYKVNHLPTFNNWANDLSKSCGWY